MALVSYAERPAPVNLDSERLNEMSRSFWSSAILRAGLKLGVFAILEDNSLSLTKQQSVFAGMPDTFRHSSTHP